MAKPKIPTPNFRNFHRLEVSVKLAWTKRCNLENDVHARFTDFFAFSVSKTVSKSCAIDSRTKFFSFSHCGKRNPKTASETRAKWLQIDAISESRGAQILIIFDRNASISLSTKSLSIQSKASRFAQKNIWFVFTMQCDQMAKLFYSIWLSTTMKTCPIS